MSTTFTKIHEESFHDEWPNSRTLMVSIVTGDLADKVRAKVGAEHDATVTMTERGQEGGYSEYTVEWDYDFMVTVGNEEVFSTSSWSRSLDYPSDKSNWGNGLSDFINWLDKE